MRICSVREWVRSRKRCEGCVAFRVSAIRVASDEASAMFDDFDVTSFWKDSTYGKKAYVCRPPTSEVVASVELSLKYKLPASYVELMRFQNGGLPKNTYHRTKAPTSWAEDHVAITGIFSIGKERQYSLCGELGSRFWIEEWGYPAIGIYFADCPSGGHDMLCLDYRDCGPDGGADGRARRSGARLPGHAGRAELRGLRTRTGR